MIEAGDVVELKSGSPKMTIAGRTDDGLWCAKYYSYSGDKFESVIAHSSAFRIVVEKTEAAE